MNSSSKSSPSLMQFGMRGSEEYRKLISALDIAENRREKLEMDLDELANIKNDLEQTLHGVNSEIDRLLMIKDTISNNLNNHEDEEDSSSKATHNLYLKGFPNPNFITEQDLMKYFERFGKVTSARIVQRAMGKIVYGFVSFSRSYMAERALDHKPHYIRGKRIQVAQAEHEPGQYNKRGRYEPY